MEEGRARQVEELLQRGVDGEVITEAQRAALLVLAREGAAGPEESRTLSVVGVAYTLGALLVLFASGWFLVSRWASLGAGGVLAVALGYAVVLVGVGLRLTRIGFPRAAGIAQILAISLTPLLAWSLMRLAGEWPATDPLDPLWQYAPWRTSRYVVLDLATLLVALVTWRARRFPLLIVPIAVALWWTWFHVSQMLEPAGIGARFDEWVMLGGGCAMLAGADALDRWQRREQLELRDGDYAGPMWYVSIVAFAIGLMVVWFDLNRAQRHVMLPVALAVLGLSLATRRRALFAVGLAGVFGYLAWLADDVFKAGALFPIVLAALGIGMITATVWAQRRFPAIVATMRGGGKDLPWPHWVSWLPAALCVVIVAGEVRGLGDREQALFLERFRAAQKESHGPRRGNDRAR